MPLTWDDVFSTPEYQQAVQQIRAASARQFRALPEAQPKMREALTQTVAQRTRLTDLAERLNFARQEQGIKQRALSLKEREIGRERARQPIGTAISLAGVGVEGLRGFGTLRAGQRAEAQTRSLQQSNLRLAEAQQAQARSQTASSQRQEELLSQLYARFYGQRNFDF